MVAVCSQWFIQTVSIFKIIGVAYLLSAFVTFCTQLAITLVHNYVIFIYFFYEK